MRKLFLLILIVLPLFAFAPSNITLHIDYSYYKKLEEKRNHINTIIKTFSHQESRGNYNAIGGSGDKGKYQILPATWRGWCKMYFGKQLEMSPENQEKMIFTVITDWVNQGLTTEQIAAKWNSGSHIGWKNKIGINKYGVPYNVPQYVANFVKQYNKIREIS
jgi:hypothetical protein